MRTSSNPSLRCANPAHSRRADSAYSVLAKEAQSVVSLRPSAAESPGRPTAIKLSCFSFTSLRVEVFSSDSQRRLATEYHLVGPGVPQFKCLTWRTTGPTPEKFDGDTAERCFWPDAALEACPTLGELTTLLRYCDGPRAYHELPSSR